MRCTIFRAIAPVPCVAAGLAFGDTRRMHGWGTVVLIAGVELLAAFALARFVSAQPWHYLMIVVLSVPIFWLSLDYTGDVSQYLPAGWFAEGDDGKNQIALASALSTVLIAVMLASAVFWAARRCWQRFVHG